MRKIPVTMATQHPDNARKAYFCDRRFISARDEIEECYQCFSDLGVHEYMWDWEGKFVDEAVIDRLFNKYYGFFKENQLGKDLFLTFRVPNIWVEQSHKLPRSFMNLITAERAAKNYDFHSPPLFEVILPMTTEGKQLIYLQKTFAKIARSTEDIFEMKSDMRMIDVIPLIEDFASIANCQQILGEYLDYLKDEFDHQPEYLRVFTARSDPALNAGFLPAKLANKQALHLYHQLGEQRGIEVYPWVGGGSLPFRGGINPENIDEAIDEYRGVGSLTVQSAFRYDYDIMEVKKAIRKMNEKIPEGRKKYEKLSDEEVQAITDFNTQVAKMYCETIEQVADLINTVAGKMPSHRERVQHVGLFGYSRGVGNVTLPRAIKFTGSMYSLGVPPELIGSGRALKLAEKMGISDLVHRLCPYLKADFGHAGHYLNRENLDLLCADNDAWKAVRDEVEDIEKMVGVEIGPTKPHHMIHRNFTSNIYHRMKLDEDFAKDVLLAAEIRKSLG